MPKEFSSSVKIFCPRYSRTELVDLLRERLACRPASVPLKRAVLLGSWANGRATAFSDIDVLVVYSDPPREDVYRLLWHHLDLRGLELHVYSEQEAKERKRTLQRMTQDGVVLFP